MASGITKDQLVAQVIAEIENATEGDYCEVGLGISEQDTTQKKKCYKIVDGMYVQVPCWADPTGQI